MTLHLRSLTPRPVTVDREARTVEAIASRFTDVRRAGFIERISAEGLDLSRLIGAPVLDGHRAQTTRDQLGVIEAAELRAEGLWVRIRFRSNEAALAVFHDIADGTLRGLSVGFTVAKWTERQENGQRVRIATAWTPLEVSIVPIPADPGATFRNMSMEHETVAQETPPPTDLRAIQTQAETNREIRSIASTAGLARDWADEQIDSGATAEAARQAAFAAMQARSAETRTTTTRATITAEHDTPAAVAERAGEALYARSHPDHQLSPQARPFAYMTFADHARESLRRSGQPVQALSPEAIITRALHTTSDFPWIVGATMHRELRRSYEGAASGVRQIARQATNRDFRPTARIALGAAPTLEKVNEAGEFRAGTMATSASHYRLETFGRIVNVSRQVLVNDDLGAFNDLPQKMGQAARAFENRTLAAMVYENPVLDDGAEVFLHVLGNTSTVTSTVFEQLSEARRELRNTVGFAGEPLNITPKFVLVSPDMETEMEKALAEVQAGTTADANPFSRLTLVVDPWLPSTHWYVVADPAAVDSLEYAYLEGAAGPQIETRAGFEVDGVQTKIRLDFGCGWIDRLGWFRVGPQ